MVPHPAGVLGGGLALGSERARRVPDALGWPDPPRVYPLLRWARVCLWFMIIIKTTIDTKVFIVVLIKFISGLLNH